MGSVEKSKLSWEFTIQAEEKRPGMDQVLDDIAKYLPLGVHYYIVDPQDRAIDGPWSREEISRRFAACTIEGAAVAYWINQKWVRSLHFYSKVDEGHKETTIVDIGIG